MSRLQWVIWTCIGALWLLTLFYLIASTKGATCSNTYPC